MGTEHIHHQVEHGLGLFPQLLLALPFLLLIFVYIYGVIRASRTYKPWPIYRTMFWIIGALLAMITLVGPLAERAHHDFVVHMVGHLLLGMVAPLLMVLAAPMTLLMRAMRVKTSRKISRLLKTRFVLFYIDPVVASIFNIGGLWLLYTTGLYSMMHQSVILHLVIHFHVFVAGYLFTVAIITIDPLPYKKQYLYCSVAAVFAFACHGILSKYLYAHPPVGVIVKQAEIGSMLMYYGGDLVDAVLFFILCLQWYKASRPRTTSAA